MLVHAKMTATEEVFRQGTASAVPKNRPKKTPLAATSTAA
jgi:hypothetical protein